MAIILPKEPNPIIECFPLNRDIPSISKGRADRGYIYLHALNDIWIYPWIYRNVTLNIKKIYLPENHLGIISSPPHSSYPSLVEVKTEFAPLLKFPDAVKVRNGYGILPYKIHAGDRVAILHMVPLFECHPFTEYERRPFKETEEKSYIGG